jgi:undecaprenyl-diphosphatase
MSHLEAMLLGLVQGLTEFLPVSSSGHLVVFQSLLEVEQEGGLIFEVAVHVATLLAIAIFYREKIQNLVKGLATRSPDALRYIGKLMVGTIPAIVVALAAKSYLDRVLSNPMVAAAGFLVTGGILWTTRSTLTIARDPEPSWSAALWIGVAQACAILPGISRSGSTVAAALALGVAPLAAAEFSFLLGIVAISGAAVLMLPGLGEASPEVLSGIAMGCFAALFSGLAAIWSFVFLLRSQNFYKFAYYTWTVGLLFGLYILIE